MRFYGGIVYGVVVNYSSRGTCTINFNSLRFDLRLDIKDMSYGGRYGGSTYS